MKLKVKVIPRAQQPGIEKMADASLKVRLKAVPEKGLANDELMAVLADYFKVSKSQIKIIGGFKARNKLIEIDGI